MKRLILIAIFSFISFNYMSAQWGPSNGSLSSGKEAEIKWETTLIDLGNVKQYNPAEAVFTLTNTGGKPIIITSAKGSCGCTEIEFSKQPVMPGKTTEIKVIFDAEDIGVFNKTITLTMNIEKGNQVLHLKGTVIK